MMNGTSSKENQDFLKAFRLGHVALVDASGRRTYQQGGGPYGVRCIEGVGGRRGRKHRRAQARKAGR